ncbi:MAG: hypothetical protein AAFY64_05000, partial [Pseudomonadota bacterium]
MLFATTKSFDLTFDSSYTLTSVEYLEGDYFVGWGGTPSAELVRFSSAGLVEASSDATSLDHRSLFIGPDGTLHARAFGSNIVYKMSATFNQFEQVVTLQGVLEPQQQVTYDAATNKYYGNNNGTVTIWNTDGTRDRD